MTEQTISKKIGFLSFFSSPWLKLVLALVILYVLVALNRIDLDIFFSLKETWSWLVLALLLMMPPYLIVSYRFWLVLRNQGVNCGFPLATRWTMIGSFFDLVMPSNSGGDIIKAGYIFKYLEVGNRTKGVMAVAFDRILGVIGLFLLASVSSLLGWVIIKPLPGSSDLIIFLILVSILPLLFFRVLGARRLSDSDRVRSFFAKFSMENRIFSMITCFNSLRENPKQLALILGLSVLNHVFWCSALFCIVIAFNQSVALAHGFVIFPMAIFSNVFGFAGGFGVGTAAFDVIFSNLLNIQVGAAIGLTFQMLSAISRLAGLPFYLKSSPHK